MTSALTIPHPGRIAEDQGITLACEAGLVPSECWFPERSEPGPHSADWVRVRTAKWLCGRCPLKQPCLDYALRTNQRYGIWAGTGDHERNDIRKGRRPHPFRPDEQATAA